MKRKKEHLVPFEKSRRIIQLDRRGEQKKKMSVGVVVFASLGVLCLLYCLSILLFMGYGTRFFLIWGVLAMLCGGVAWLLWHRAWMKCLPKWLKGCTVGGFALALALFLIIEGMICSEFAATPRPGADYVVVLGAQWKSNGPSYVLKKRLDKAVEYLKANPETLVIVSGGQGANEPISEARGMQGYLIGAGIAPERIQMEDTSTNTVENLVFSSEYLDKAEDRVVIVTNNFHVFRAVKIAEKQGYGNVEGLAAGSYPGMLPNNMLREFFGVIKDFMEENL